MSGKIEALISQMTVEDKVSMLAGADQWHTVPVKRLGEMSFTSFFAEESHH